MAHLFNVVVYDSFNRKNVKISTTYYFLDFSFFMSQDDAHYQNRLNAPFVLTLLPPTHPTYYQIYTIVCICTIPNANPKISLRR